MFTIAARKRCDNDSEWDFFTTKIFTRKDFPEEDRVEICLKESLYGRKDSHSTIHFPSQYQEIIIESATARLHYRFPDGFVSESILTPKGVVNIPSTLFMKLGEDDSDLMKILESVVEDLKKAGIKITPTEPVDRSNQVLSSGDPVPPDGSHTKLKENGQQQEYAVLSKEEREKGFVRPVRMTYVHTVCGATTSMAKAIAETYARDPSFYSSTFCTTCGKHFPLKEFVWEGTDQQVGT